MAEVGGPTVPLRDSRNALLFALVIGSAFFGVAQHLTGRHLPLVIDESLWQVTDMRFLAGKSLWGLLLTYHAQPPGLLVLQWLEVNFLSGVIAVSLLAAEWAAVCGMGAIAQLLLRRWWATSLVTAYIAFHPSTLLYGNWFFSSAYLYALVALAVVAIILWVRSGRKAVLAVTGFLLAVAAQFHSAYYAVFFAAFAVVITMHAMSASSGASSGWASAIVLAAALVLVAIMPLKNYILFDQLAPSSWGKLNISLVLNTIDYFGICKNRVFEYENNIQKVKEDRKKYYWADRELLFAGTESRGGININHVEVLRCSREIALLQNIDRYGSKTHYFAGFEFIALPLLGRSRIGRDRAPSTCAAGHPIRTVSAAGPVIPDFTI